MLFVVSQKKARALALEDREIGWIDQLRIDFNCKTIQGNKKNMANTLFSPS
jgi:hypothetical protein